MLLGLRLSAFLSLAFGPLFRFAAFAFFRLATSLFLGSLSGFLGCGLRARFGFRIEVRLYRNESFSPVGFDQAQRAAPRSEKGDTA